MLSASDLVGENPFDDLPFIRNEPMGLLIPPPLITFAYYFKDNRGNRCK